MGDARSGWYGLFCPLRQVLPEPLPARLPDSSSLELLSLVLLSLELLCPEMSFGFLVAYVPSVYLA
jgi:hypothetical protein